MKIFHIQNANDTETRVNGGGVEDFVADSISRYSRGQAET